MSLVPISKRALSWAVSESGISQAEIDQHLQVPQGTVERWIEGDGKPNQTQFNRIKSLLKRPASIFFMDEPPVAAESEVAVRFAFGATGQTRSQRERLAIRDSLRVRNFVADLLSELGRSRTDYPAGTTNENPEDVANRVRKEHFGVSIEEQMSWSSHAEAFRQWRTLIERMHILVFLYPLGEDSARGFSVATEPPPVIGVSTTWDASVRIYTLFHELGHILTRTSSSCVEASTKQPTVDPIERWCESFAASFLMPRKEIEAISGHLQSNDPISIATRISDILCVNRKSALLRLIETGRAHWEDLQRLESRNAKKKSRGPTDPDRKRTRDIVRRDTYGSRLSTVRDAYRARLVSEADIRTYLRMYPEELT